MTSMEQSFYRGVHLHLERQVASVLTFAVFLYQHISGGVCCHTIALTAPFDCSPLSFSFLLWFNDKTLTKTEQRVYLLTPYMTTQWLF